MIYYRFRYMAKKVRNSLEKEPLITVSFLMTKETNEKLERFLIEHREIKKGMFADAAILDRMKRYENIHF